MAPSNGIIHGDCLSVMRDLPDGMFTAVVSDPPYGLEFMGKGWDKVLPDPRVWEECLRLLKPGGVALVFGGTRTFHRLTCDVEDAGFQIRDCLAWMYGSGFPKGTNIGKKVEGWDGYNTTLKPAWEPIVLAVKPHEGTYAANAVRHGVAGINVEGCRVDVSEEDRESWEALKGFNNTPRTTGKTYASGKVTPADDRSGYNTNGRWPANVVHDGSEDAAAGMGNASRYFYCAKASKRDRGADNDHPTVKPTALMRWLVRMVTMPSGTLILDPFAGSGSTIVAASMEGVEAIGIEMDEHFAELANRRASEVSREEDAA